MPSIEVDDEVWGRLEFGRRLTGWSYSEIIRRLALVEVQEAERTIASMGELAAGAPTALSEPVQPRPQMIPQEVEPEDASRFSGRIPKPRDLAEMIEAEYLFSGKIFRSDYLGEKVEYRLLEDGGLSVNGEEYTSPGKAMQAAYGKNITNAWGLIHDEAGRSLRNIARDWWAKKEELGA